MRTAHSKRPLVEGIARLRSWSSMRVFLVASALLMGITALELLTPQEMSFSEAFLVPVMFVALARGLRWGAGFAALSCAAGLLHERVEGIAYSKAWFPFWNWGLRALSFIAFSAFLAALRERLAAETALARVDPLTGALNARAFHERLRVELARVARERQPLSLIYLDLDRFKALNDSRGHAEGDRALSTLVDVSRRVLRQADTVARLGGDEFVLLLPNLDRPSTESVLSRLRESWEAAARMEQWDVGLSLGVATGGPEASAEELLQAADRAMYQAKRTRG